ncbi:TfoX/Sxy family protein [Microbacterium sp. Au-Mic1]|uniref:TfoX/Sxy family protein n=1 Tax=Microbacterium sp. Au-Mic1 TaxID=2906457 RepID=UPI001E427389|nr:TfoX/Sxy family protein [Microbacterium sp. Au-Mic1]MCE4026014.1 TfoX/Sxy family protein [Microbacterium sp. Au-Mic1]
MQIPRPSEDSKDFFRSIIPAAPGVEVKPMFGNLGAFVNGNMFAGLFGDDLGVRLIDDASLNALRSVPGTDPFGPAERPMGGYLALPADWRDEPERAAEWVSAALEQVGALPPKKPKARAPRKKA